MVVDLFWVYKSKIESLDMFCEIVREWIL
jgi:hypothetical protein